MGYTHFQPLLLGVNATARITSQKVGGFLCKTTGTLTVARADGSLVIDAHPVTNGEWYDLPLYIGPYGGTVTLGGGASGTLAV